MNFSSSSNGQKILEEVKKLHQENEERKEEKMRKRRERMASYGKGWRERQEEELAKVGLGKEERREERRRRKDARIRAFLRLKRIERQAIDNIDMTRKDRIDVDLNGASEGSLFLVLAVLGQAVRDAIEPAGGDYKMKEKMGKEGREWIAGRLNGDGFMGMTGACELLGLDEEEVRRIVRDYDREIEEGREVLDCSKLREKEKEIEEKEDKIEWPKEMQRELMR